MGKYDAVIDADNPVSALFALSKTKHQYSSFFRVPLELRMKILTRIIDAKNKGETIVFTRDILHDMKVPQGLRMECYRIADHLGAKRRKAPRHKLDFEFEPDPKRVEPKPKEESKPSPVSQNPIWGSVIVVTVPNSVSEMKG